MIDGPMNRELFELYVETQLAPTLRTGDVIILDNLSSHKSPKAAEAMRAVGAWFLFLPPCSPDLNPIEMAFARLKALIRRAAARTYDELWRAVGHVCNLSLKTNATTSSKRLAMKPIKRNAPNLHGHAWKTCRTGTSDRSSKRSFVVPFIDNLPIGRE